MDFYDLLLAKKLNGGGGGGGSSITGDEILTRSYGGVLSAPNATGAVPNYSCEQSNITSVVAPKIDRLNSGVFRNCTSLATAEFELCEYIGTDCFYGCSALTSAYFPKARSFNTSAFKNCTSIEVLCFPEGGLIYAYTYSGVAANFCEGCTSLKKFDVLSPNGIQANVFKGCTALNDLIIRKTSVCSLSNVNAFDSMGGKAVNVYVPSNLISSYETASNWSSVTGATLTFKAIEGSVYETKYADGTSV